MDYKTDEKTNNFTISEILSKSLKNNYLASSLYSVLLLGFLFVCLVIPFI